MKTIEEVNNQIKALEDKKAKAVKKHQGTKGVDGLLKPLYQERFDLNQASGAEQIESIQDNVLKTSPFLKPLLEFAQLLDNDNLTERQREQQKVEHCSAGKVLGSFIWSLSNNLKRQITYLDDRFDDLENHLLSQYAGSDMHEDGIYKRKEYINTLTTSIEEIEETISCLNAVYLATVGVDYKAYSKGTSKDTLANQQVTAGRCEAIELIAKHKARKVS
jgi:hypothetical protein